MQAPHHDPEYRASFKVARHVARLALSGLANYLTSPSSIASEAIMRLVNSERLTTKNRGHAESLTAKAVRFAVKDRLRRDSALKRGGREVIQSLDENTPCDAAFLLDNATELAAYIEAQDEFEFRFKAKRPEAVRAIDAWLAHGKDIESACHSTGIESSVMHAAILLYVPLYGCISSTQS